MITNLTKAPDTIASEPQPTAEPTHTTGGSMTINKEKAGEQTKAEVADKAGENIITQEGLVGNGQDRIQAIALLSSFRAHILYWLKIFP